MLGHSFAAFIGKLVFNIKMIIAAVQHTHWQNLQRLNKIRAPPILISVSVSGQYQHFLVVSESVKYVAQIPIPLLY